MATETPAAAGTAAASAGTRPVPTDPEALRAAVRERYAAAAVRAGAASRASGAASCCGPDAADAGRDPITADLYAAEETAELPEAAVLASLGCGNPTALAELRLGETVLDLGSGGGIDVLLSARRVGPAGFAYGLDMTDEMLALAERNRREAGAENVRFLKGAIERIPLPDESVDVIISNCVINLSADKDAVLREAFRVLKPGGRFAVSDVVVLEDLPAAVRTSMEAWAGCVAGALHERDYRAKLAAAGFAAPEVRVTRTYGLADLQGAGGEGSCCGPAEAAPAEDLAAAEGALASAFVRATKPA
jgi:SAM-dependent methyltransferase